MPIVYVFMPAPIIGRGPFPAVCAVQKKRECAYLRRPLARQFLSIHDLREKRERLRLPGGLWQTDAPCARSARKKGVYPLAFSRLTSSLFCDTI